MRDRTTSDLSLKAFAKNWLETGPLLDAMRSREVAALTEEEARRQTLTLLALWRPGFNQPMSGLVAQQAGFRKLERYLQARIGR
ncbi:MAG: hypothetical protein L0387_01690 [Acidobacteria bacterium]|nr:hypothetical protein [Acidobacteriota bacterium]MCI0620383.1 hypothetical protein [Acidobacteriota bacterium]MCI0719280.1 hypothetical protein [Acidobacteriota bacterium]